MVRLKERQGKEKKKSWTNLTAFQYLVWEEPPPNLFQHQGPSKQTNVSVKSQISLWKQKYYLVKMTHIQEYAAEHWKSVIADTSKLSSRTHNQTENLQGKNAQIIETNC